MAKTSTNPNIATILEKVVEVEKHIHSGGSWFGLALENDGYTIAGCTSPDYNGRYIAIDLAYNTKTAYQNKDGSGFLYWDGTDTWIIESALGAGDADYFSLTSANPDDTGYSNQGSATGTVTATADLDHKADRIGICAAPFQIDGGNSSSVPTWGSWVQIFGADDTPARTGQAYFDPHLLLITNAQEETTYMIQFTRGATGDAGITAGTYTELCVGIDATKKFKEQTPVQTGRASAGSLLWARCIAVGKNTGTLDFYMGIHEYSE